MLILYQRRGTFFQQYISSHIEVVFAQFDGPTKLSQHFDLRIRALPTINVEKVSDLPGPALLRELQGAYEGYTLSSPGFDVHTKNLLHEHLHVLSHDIHKESSKTLKTALNTYNDAKKLVSAAVQDVSTAEHDQMVQCMTVQVAKKKRDHCQEELRVAAETYNFVLRETMVCAQAQGQWKRRRIDQDYRTMVASDVATVGSPGRVTLGASP